MLQIIYSIYRAPVVSFPNTPHQTYDDFKKRATMFEYLKFPNPLPLSLIKTARKYNIPGSIITRAKALSAVFDDVCRGSSRGAESAGEREESPSWWPSEGRGWGGKSPGGFRTMTDAIKASLIRARNVTVGQNFSAILKIPERDLIAMSKGFLSVPYMALIYFFNLQKQRI